MDNSVNFDEEDQNKFYHNFSRTFQKDVRALARHYIEQFFSDKMFYCGGSIPKYFLFSDCRVSMVLNYDITRGVKRVYKYLEPLYNIDPKNKSSGETGEDVLMVLKALNMLEKAGVPQQFAGGMMCMYIELVEGIDIGKES
jgi:hypothetical protein